jgi:hypothetical protein
MSVNGLGGVSQLEMNDQIVFASLKELGKKNP